LVRDAGIAAQAGLNSVTAAHFLSGRFYLYQYAYRVLRNFSGIAQFMHHLNFASTAMGLLAKLLAVPVR
jgi:hypothetical protein